MARQAGDQEDSHIVALCLEDSGGGESPVTRDGELRDCEESRGFVSSKRRGNGSAHTPSVEPRSGRHRQPAC
jgi:hypothetical protein